MQVWCKVCNICTKANHGIESLDPFKYARPLCGHGPWDQRRACGHVLSSEVAADLARTCAQVVNAGAHRCVCVQLKLYHLAVAAVEKCEALAELEGATSVGPAPGAGPAFKVLKQLVHNWLLDTVQTGNRCVLAFPQTFPFPVFGHQVESRNLALIE